ncbi:MAG: DivIVA domain-containing protein [Propionibacteriaceae bacterium]|jgi:DivIVA domain-containing protein|nr:DivIVA domain-containing protein [Propionibacteriaceae bacterium]
MIQLGLAAVACVVIGVTWLAAQGRFGAMPPLVDDRPGPDLPADADVNGDDLRDVRLAVVTRGYSMKQVDDLLDRLADQLDTPRAELAPAGDVGSKTAALGWPGSAVETSVFAATEQTALGWPV